MYKDFKQPIFDARHKEMMLSSRCHTAEAERLDHVLLEAHLDRLGAGTLLMIGENKAIFNREFYFLDPSDRTLVARYEGGTVRIPAAYASLYLGEEVTGDDDGYTNFSVLCAERNLSLFYDEQTGLVAVTVSPTMPVSRREDPAFLDRLARTFHEPLLPEPQYNTVENTRRVIAEATFPCEVYDWRNKDQINLYSPSLHITEENGKTVYYISHERSQCVGGVEIATETVLLRSEDRGETWTQVAACDNFRWAILFEVDGVLYLCGSTVRPKHSIAIACLAGSEFSVSVLPDTDDPDFISNPNPYLIKNGRIYLPTAPYILSAPTDADLLDPTVWTRSNSMKDLTPPEWFFAETGAVHFDFHYWPLEANMIDGRDGNIYVMMRLECHPYNGYVGLLTLTPDGKTLARAEGCNGLVEMPSTVSKFTVRYDSATDLYITLPSYPALPTPIPRRGGIPPSGHRNVLCIAASRDLVHWRMLDILLVDRAVMTPLASSYAHGFQYVVWDRDGDTIHFVVREAVGMTSSYHDGKYVTMYTLENYPTFVTERFAKSEDWHTPGRKKEQ